MCTEMLPRRSSCEGNRVGLKSHRHLALLKVSFLKAWDQVAFKRDSLNSPPLEGAVKKSPPILGGVEARKSFGGGKGRP
jgi:hypothetical protein